MSKDQQVIFGWHPVIEALASGKELQRVYLQQGLRSERVTELQSACKAREIPVQQVPVQRLDRFTRKNHQGVVALLSPVEFADLANLIDMVFSRGELPSLLAMDGVTDVRNFGAICRSAECFGFHGVIVPTTGSSPINEDAIRSSSGALLRLPICRTTDLAKSIQAMQQSGIRVIGMTEKASTLLPDISSSGPVCLVMGNEETGLSNPVLRLCDDLARIPMSGSTASLNVSVSAAVGMYHLSITKGKILD